ncbi:MAG: DNA polymerase III subunit delta [Longispora sp.]|nr:DNA polymerase III subunit delta [Longispora sp. (in: high G+C Gram-positive bacteria)]
MWPRRSIPAYGTWDYDGVSPTGPAVRLVLGDEEFLASRVVAEVVRAVKAQAPVPAEADIREYDAGDLPSGAFAEAVSPSLFGGERVLVIRNGQDAKKDLIATLLAYAKAPDPDVFLVVTHVGGAKGKALAEGLRAAGAEVIAASKMTRARDRTAFVRDEIRRLGGSCTDDAAEELTTAIGADLRELAAACAQLVTDTGGKINGEVVRRYYRGRAEVSGFTVADAVVAGDVAGALEALRWALSIGVDPVPIADALADGIRSVARVAGRSGSGHQLASSLGMPPWKIERAQRQARGWTSEGLVTAMYAAAEVNAAVKGGAEDRGYALERAILTMTRARRESR